MQRDSQVKASGAILSQPGFADRDWLVATVPGTVLASYYNAGAVPNPDFGDNQFTISDSFFYADFWYRNEFTPPPATPASSVWLNFAGINWKAEVYPQRRETRPHRRRLHARPFRRHRQAARRAARVRWPSAS